MKQIISVWTTKDGRKIKVCEMTDSHLQNTIKLLEKNAAAERGNAIYSGLLLLGTLNGEMAIESVERGLAALEEDEDYCLPEIYFDMVDECDKRGIEC